MVRVGLYSVKEPSMVLGLGLGPEFGRFYVVGKSVDVGLWGRKEYWKDQSMRENRGGWMRVDTE
jgi:hypothetical protein